MPQNRVCLTIQRDFLCPPKNAWLAKDLSRNGPRWLKWNKCNFERSWSILTIDHFLSSATSFPSELCPLSLWPLLTQSLVDGLEVTQSHPLGCKTEKKKENLWEAVLFYFQDSTSSSFYSSFSETLSGIWTAFFVTSPFSQESHFGTWNAFVFVCYPETGFGNGISRVPEMNSGCGTLTFWSLMVKGNGIRNSWGTEEETNSNKIKLNINLPKNN